MLRFPSFDLRSATLGYSALVLVCMFAAPPALACPSGPDVDQDGVCDPDDNCLDTPNPSQLDTDLDGFGNRCDADLDANGRVDGRDFLRFLESFGMSERDAAYALDADADGSATVDGVDFGHFIEQYSSTGRPGPSGLACAGRPPCAAPPPAPSQAEHVLARLTYGANAATRQEIEALGVTAFIEAQLAPGSLADPALGARLARLASLTMDVPTLRARFDDATPREELTEARILRMLSSRRQLEEQLVDFWFNHFSVFAGGGNLRRTVVPFERDAIRPHVLGRFSDMLIATARSAAMLEYLDNRFNRDGGLNENYSRELLELHTMGVDSGYTQADIEEVARTLTGWTLDQSQPDGFRFRSDRHDDASKAPLGFPIDAGEGLSGGERLLEHLARRPETARFLARKLVVRFVDESAPERLVGELANRYLATEGDLRAVMRVLLGSPEFLDTPRFRGSKVKRPAVLVASLARRLDAPVDAIADTVEDQIAELGESPFRARPPTGYPDTSGAWASPGGLVTTLNQIERAARGRDGYAPAFGIDDGANGFEIVDALIARWFPEGVSAATRSGAIGVTHALRTRPVDQRVEQAAAFLLSSPEFLLH
ncbi:MAG: DUF1800 domain-containing protein [Myxococcota bacterium]